MGITRPSACIKAQCYQILTADQSSTSNEEAHRSISNLTTLVLGILESSEDVSRRLASIETGIADRDKYVPSTTRKMLDYSDDAATTASIKSIHVNEPSVTPATTAEPLASPAHHERELRISRVYLRTARRHSIHSISSFPSTPGSTSGWSSLSDISLAQISNFSILSLPISHCELWNPTPYNASINVRRPLRSKSDVLPTQKGEKNLVRRLFRSSPLDPSNSSRLGASRFSPYLPFKEATLPCEVNAGVRSLLQAKILILGL